MRIITIQFIIIIAIIIFFTRIFPQNIYSTDNLEEFNNNIVKIVDIITPSIVYIKGTKKSFNSYFGNDTESKDYGRDNIPQNIEAFGSGVIVSNDGFILTNNHVIEGFESIIVVLYDDKEFDVSIIGKDSTSDLAILKITSSSDKFTPAKLGDSDKVKAGELVFAVGSPFGLRNSVTQGIVSSNARRKDMQKFIQTDAAINQGNSGGALVNIKGEVIGINTAILTKSYLPQATGFQGIGLAIPINKAKSIMTNILRNKKVIRGYLGITAANQDNISAQYLKISKGVMIKDVLPNSPASEVELKPWDIILSYNDKTILNNDQLQELIDDSAIDKKIKLKVLRKEDTIEVEVTIKQIPELEKKDDLIKTNPRNNKNDFQDDDNLGLKLKELTLEQKNIWGYDHGLWVQQVSVSSKGEKYGIEPGDVLLEIEGNELNSIKDFISLVSSYKNINYFRIRLLRVRLGTTILIVIER